MLSDQVSRLAAAIVAERLAKQRPERVESRSCFACGRSFSRGDERFCSMRCRAAFDAGLPAFKSPNQDGLYSLPVGLSGFYVECPQCRTRFESHGMRCCSPECERTLSKRHEMEAELAAVGMRISSKRKCGWCGGDIPNWRKGRRVSKATKFCSPRCKEKHRRKCRSEC